MNWASACVLGSLLVLATCRSDALATSFNPRMTPRGGETVGSIIRNPATGGWSPPQRNGVRLPPVYNTETETETLEDEIIDAVFVADTELPTDAGNFRLRSYRIPQGRNEFLGTEPCVIYSANNPPFGKNGAQARDVPVRIHDQCVTSEVFGSKRCDCREQLKMALHYVAANGGAIIYLQQEGRGIGFANKVAAYALQDHGMDTVEANLHLGLPEDCRQYGAVPSMLAEMGIGSIRLMTNNPRKVDRLASVGVRISDTMPWVVKQANVFNRRYLETKKKKMNHTNFGQMLARDTITNGAMSPKKYETGTFSDGHPSTNGYSHANGHSNGFKTKNGALNGITQEFLNDGKRMATHAVQISLTEEITGEETEMEGVRAREDGYCFGRESVEEAIAAIARGEMVVVVDDMDRENEGDFIMAADMCTPEAMAKIIRYSSGVVCVTMEGSRLEELQLPPMVTNNQDPKGTAFTVTVDGSKEKGITTGISAQDRSVTARLLADKDTKPSDLMRPGHIFPLRAREGGVLTRDGHTEASVDLARLAGRSPCGVICEIVSEENLTEMARLPELVRFAKKHKMVLTSIVDLIQYRRDTGR